MGRAARPHARSVRAHPGAVLRARHPLRRHAAGGKPSQRELSDHTGLDPVFVSKLVRTLEGNELLLRTADPADSRAVRLALTDHGAEVIEAAGARVMTLQNQLAEPLGGRDSERTREFVATLTTLLDAPPPDLGRTP